MVPEGLLDLITLQEPYIRIGIFDETGNVPLYLRKTPFGIYREERK